MLDWIGICLIGLGRLEITVGTTLAVIPYMAYFAQMTVTRTSCGIAG